MGRMWSAAWPTILAVARPRRLWALAVTDHRAPTLVSSASRCLAAHMLDLDAADLANSLWATSMLRAYDPDFAAAVVEQAWDVLPHATPRQTVSILQVCQQSSAVF